MAATVASHLPRRRILALFLCLAVQAAVAGCGGSSPASASAEPATPGFPSSPIGPSTASSSVPSPESATPPGPTLRPADSYPLVDSCDPSSVPGATAVTTPARGQTGSFVLRVPVLMYHRIVPYAQAGDSIKALVVPPDPFGVQLDALEAAGWHTITMAALADDLAKHTMPPAKTFVITIDDGWAEGYTYALPILQAHGYVATYFVIAGRIDHSGFLSSAQLLALTAAGDEIGDHTMDHVNLPAQKDDKLKLEIETAAARIAQVTGRWPESLAYPAGAEDSRVLAAVAGCQELRIAVLEEFDLLTPSGATQSPAVPWVKETWSARFAVPRVRVTGGTRPAELMAELERYR